MPSESTKQYNRLARLAELKKTCALFFYKPYAKQTEFHGAGCIYRERLLMAGNQLGKCITVDSYIITPEGPQTVANLNAGDLVMAWDGEKAVPAKIGQPFKKPGLHNCFRLVMSDGRFIDCADQHRVLTGEGWHFVQSLYAFALDRLESNSGHAQSTHAANALHWYEKLQGCQDHYFEGYRHDDELPHVALNSALALAPFSSGAPQRSLPLSRLGALVGRYTSIVRQGFDRLSSRGVVRRCVGRFVESLTQAAYRPSAPNLLRHQVSRLLSSAANLVIRSMGGVALPAPDAWTSEILPWKPLSIDGNHIIAIIPIGRCEVWDFEVETHHNYCAAGLVHHNTYAAGNEVAMHVTGLYPDDWNGKRFNGAVRGWVGSVTSELTRDGAQRILLGPVGRWGTGCIPKQQIVEIKRARGVPDAVETILVKHESGEISQITFKSYKDGREAWQAETLDFIWYDEEPPEDIYVEGVTRTNNTRGLVFLTFTPLLGMSNVVMRFYAKDPSDSTKPHPDRHITNMTIHDVEHYDEDQKRQIIAAYPAHEREARAMGIPMLGSGRIFPIAEEVLREDPIGDLPKGWKQIIGMDFGWDHPTGAVKLVLDPLADCIHVVAAYRQSETTPLIHAAAIKPWGDWVPVAWPHDALQHDKSGEQYKKLYSDQGLSMLSEHAAYADKRKNGVEEGLMDILQRMQTGRWKVDRTLSQWWEEFRMYHRKDGQVVKERDDLMSATRYAVMMLRYAIPEESAPKRPDRYASRQQTTATWMSA